MRAVTLLGCSVFFLELCVCVVSGQWCAPKLFETQRWTLQIRQTDQGAEIVESSSSLSFDVIGQRLVSQETGTRNGQHYEVYYFYLLPSRGHVVDYLTKEYLGAQQEGCPIMGGIYDQDGLGSMYTFDYEGAIPLFEGLDGEIDGVPTYTVSSYLNVTLGIADPTVFVPPDSCVKAKVLWGSGPDTVPKLHSVVLDL